MHSRKRWTIDEKFAALRQTELFADLNDGILRKVAGLAVVRQLKRGQILYSEDDQASGLYVVASGELRSVRQGVEGREQALSTERPGAILSVVPIIDGGKFFSTAIADTDAEVLCLEIRHVQELCREHPELLWNLAKLLARTVRQYAGLIETLALRNVDQRVAQYLLTVARQRGVHIDEEGSIVELTLTQIEIANRLGSVREVVSRALSHLRELGLIKMEGRRLVTVPNMRALSEFAHIPSGKRPAKAAPELFFGLV